MCQMSAARIVFPGQVCLDEIEKDYMIYLQTCKVPVLSVGYLFTHFETRHLVLLQILDYEIDCSENG